MKKNIFVIAFTVFMALCLGLFLEYTQDKNYSQTASGSGLDNTGYGWGIKKVKGRFYHHL